MTFVTVLAVARTRANPGGAVKQLNWALNSQSSGNVGKFKKRKEYIENIRELRRNLQW